MKKIQKIMLVTATITSALIVCSTTANAAPLDTDNTNYEDVLHSLFDADWYASSYPDVVKVYGDNENALFEHFMTFGINEGRNINGNFDVERYKDSYPDLTEAFAGDYASYYKHYATYGLAEHRTLGNVSESAGTELINPSAADNTLSTDMINTSNVAVANNTSSAAPTVSASAAPADDIDDSFEVEVEYQKILKKVKIQESLERLKASADNFETIYSAMDKIPDSMDSFDPSIYSYDIDFYDFDDSCQNLEHLSAAASDANKAYAEYDNNHTYNLDDTIHKLNTARNKNATKEQIEDAKLSISTALTDSKEKYNLCNQMVSSNSTRSSSAKRLYDSINSYRSGVFYSYTEDFGNKYNYYGRLSDTLSSFKECIIDGYKVYDNLYQGTQFWNTSTLMKYDDLVMGYDNNFPLYPSYHHFDNYYDTLEYTNLDTFGKNFYAANTDMISTYDYCNTLGLIIEDSSDEVHQERIAYESSATCKAYKRLVDSYFNELTKYITLFNYYFENQELFDNKYKANTDLLITQYIRQHVTEEQENFIKNEYELSQSDLDNSKKLLKSLDEDILKLQVAKDMVDQIPIPEDDDPSEPENPDPAVDPSQPNNPDPVVDPSQPDNPDPVVDPTQPDNPDPVVDPTQPENPDPAVDPSQPDNPDKPDNPEPSGNDKPDTPSNQPAVNIDMNVNVTINIVNEHTVNIDFNGHVEIRCAS